MTCHGSFTIGCAGHELVQPYNALPPTPIAASIYTVQHDHSTKPFLLQLPGEAPQVVIEASHPEKTSHDFLSSERPPPILLQEQVSSTTVLSVTPVEVSSLQQSFRDLMTLKRRATIVIAAIIAGWWGLDNFRDRLDPDSGWQGDEDREEEKWIASSKSTFDRGACRWLGVCGASHIGVDPAGGARKSKNREMKTATLQVADSSSNQDTASTAFKILSEHSWKFQDSLNNGRILEEIPQFVLDYAPLVHLHSGEQFFPCDISDHLLHTTLHLNYTPISAQHPTLQNLDALNDLDGGRFVFLKSDDNVEDRPDWLSGRVNIPASPEKTDFESSWLADKWDPAIDGPRPDDERKVWAEIGIDSSVTFGGLRPEPDTNNPLIPSEDIEGDELSHETETQSQRRDFSRRKSKRSSQPKPSQTKAPQSRTSPGGRSSAPAVLILVQKTPDIVDAFWFYFYSYNLGNQVLNVRFGNHVGDWEHSLVRFQNGIPRVIFFSEHSGGKAYTYDAVEKIGNRPIIYSAEGTHAMYATPGEHPYILPGGLLKDVTDKGKLWDPALNMFSYYYNYTADIGSKSHDEEEAIFRPTALTPEAPTNWFWFRGHWGDKFYQLSDSRQYRFLKQYHYVNGPLGPRFKHLGRKRNSASLPRVTTHRDGSIEAKARAGDREAIEALREDVNRKLRIAKFADAALAAKGIAKTFMQTPRPTANLSDRPVDLPTASRLPERELDTIYHQDNYVPQDKQSKNLLNETECHNTFCSFSEFHYG